MKRLFSITLLAVLALSMPVQAVRRYSCNFENASDRARWTLNPTSTAGIYNSLANKWYIGAPGNNDRNGQYGLFISDDNGATAHYTNKGCWVFAYDTIALDNITGDYLLTFDYCVMANVASEFDGLYLLWIPEYDPEENDQGEHDPIRVLSVNTSSGSVPSLYQNYIVPLQPTAGMDYLNATPTWKQCAVKIPGKKCDGTKHYLAFAWANGVKQTQQPGAMVDNINITDNSPCEQPTNLTVTQNGTVVTLNWEGTASNYEVSAYSYDAQSWAGPKIVQGTTTTFSNLAIGQTDFIVRAICDSDFYSLKTIESKLIYYPDQMCVDYLNLDNAVCYVNNSSPDRSDTFNDFRIERVDNGPGKKSSRHTVHFDRTETEPRTGGMAKTIPDGELASVRLGNWDTNDQAERIEFSFNVDTIKYPVLLLKYMPLLEAPGHDPWENPRFKLDMLINGVSIGRCGMADFNANDVMVSKNSNQLKPEAIAQGWHVTSKDVAQTSDDVVWKEWTTVGVNLRKPEYEGKQLTVRLTTHDCTFSVHSGYAYFTLGCSDGKLKGMKCGEINPDFVAPDGFVYSWAYAYNERYRDPVTGLMPEQYILGHEQKYYAGMQDDSLYVVDCMFVQDSTCFFSLYASTLATNPISKMNKPKIMMNCRENTYKVQFDASPSWVQEIDHVKGDTSVSEAYHIEHYEWIIDGLPGGWSDEVSPTFSFPVTGGNYHVTLRTTCGTCEDLLEYDLHLDPLGATRETQTITLCDADRKGAGYVWAENTKISRDTTYRTYGVVDSVVLLNPETTCDSIIYLELVEPYRIFEDTMLLPESLPFTKHGRTYGTDTKSMIDTIPMPGHCDTTWVLNLEIYESLIASMPNTAYILCEGDPALNIIYDIARGRSLRYSYTFSDPAIPSSGMVQEMQKKGHYEVAVPLNNLYPNVYEGSLLLVDSMPEFSVTIPFTVTMQYASAVIAQRWNDVLAIKNTEYNGGYQFDSVQWYVSGQPISEAIEFNYYAGEGNQLRFGEEYQALLTRNDGVKLFTCPYIPSPVSAEVTDMPSLVKPSSTLQVKGRGTASWYDMMGRRYSSEQYNDSEIRTPDAEGLFLLVLQSNNARATQHVMVR